MTINEPGQAAEPLPPQAVPAVPKKKANPKAKSREITVRATARQVTLLRTTWERTLEAHRLRVTAQLNALEKGVAAAKGPGIKELAKIGAATRLDIKPRKGRAKDLRHVEQALDRALERLRD